MLDFLINPITQLLVFLYGITGNNFGFAIITLTLIIRGILVPITIPSLKSAKKMQDLKPQLDHLKLKHKDDKQKLQQAQLDLYKEHGVNPMAGCLPPQIAQIIILISLYQVFIRFINTKQINGQDINMAFLYLNLAHPDPFYILPVLAGVSQFIFSLMMQSGLESHLLAAPKKEVAKEEDNLEMAQSMQTQMLYMMPIMTTFIALRFASGLALYWVVTTLFSIVQQYIISGPGGLIPAKNKILALINRKS